MSQFGETDDAERPPASVSLSLAETVAIVLLVILSILAVGSVVSAFATPSLFAPATVAGSGRSLTVGFALERAGEWAAPQSAALFLLGSLALAWWQIESWTNDDREPDPFDAAAFVHLRRTGVVVRIDLVLSLLTIVGGVLVAVGTALEESPTMNWGNLAENLGIALGSVVLGVAGVAVARRLQASELAAVATWHAAPVVA